VSDKSADKSARSVGSWQAERGRQTRRLPREDPRAEVGEDVSIRVGVDVGVGPMEFKLKSMLAAAIRPPIRLYVSHSPGGCTV